MNRYNLFYKAVLVVLIFTTISIVSCKKEKKRQVETQVPNLPQQVYQYSGNNDDVATLGRVLFYEKHLSANNSVSCGTCHIQAFGFSDGRQFSSGVANKLTKRNTPSITNESSGFGLFWDNRAEGFHDLVFRPITNHEEMGIIDIEKLPGKLRELGYYTDLFENAYGNDEINLEKIQDAMATFLNALERPYETKFEQGRSGNFQNYNAMELMGKEIFEGKGNCRSCHVLGGNGWASFANIGLDIHYADKGASNMFGNQVDVEGYFRVPNLINIEMTAPYMHDGRFRTLEEVVEHYNSGIKNHKDLSWELREIEEDKQGNIISTPKRLNLNSTEKKALVAFLKTLSDWDYVKDVRYSNPFMN